MIDIKTVTRPLLLPDARHRAVQTVPDPVHRDADHCRDQKTAVVSRQPVRQSCCDLCAQSQCREPVGCDPGGRTNRQPRQDSLLNRRCERAIDSAGGLKTCISLRSDGSCAHGWLLSKAVLFLSSAACGERIKAPQVAASVKASDSRGMLSR